MTAYYNENDPFAAAWLRNLIAANLIAQGEVDERSIVDVQPDDLRGFTQCHFFAGIGVWSYALRLAGWSDDRPVWTGSCPCQSFSAAGKRKGGADPRHLWPYWSRLISVCRPVTIFGEQVEAAISHGWFDLVSDELEAQDYAVGAISFPACSVGAPHIRQRLYFVADAQSQRDGSRDAGERGWAEFADCGDTGELADSPKSRRPDAREHERGPSLLSARSAEYGGSGFWSNCDWLPCIDGKARPVEPGTFPLANGSSQRVGRLRGYGNAIVAPQAQAFIEAYLDVCEE